MTMNMPRPTPRIVAIISIVAALLVLGSTHASLAAPPPPTAAPSQERIVNLGDSITDGQTYALMVEQALREAGKPVPRFFGAGIGGDTAAGMLKRLDRDVLVHHPTLVMLSCGINDVAGGVKLSDYEATVTAIAERLKAANVRLLILTTTNLAPDRAAIEPSLQRANAALHRVAAKYDLKVAEVYDRMQEARSKEDTMWLDGVHLNFAGYRHMTRAVLDSLGAADVPVPTEQHLELIPGVVRTWKVLPLHEARPPLDEKSVAVLAVNNEWKAYALPEQKKPDNFWLDQERRRGVSVSLQAEFGPAKSFIAIHDIDAPKARDACVNLGADVKAVWFNGKRLYGPGDPSHGWHPGSYRVPVRLQAGLNRIVVETESRFFIGVTDTADW